MSPDDPPKKPPRASWEAPDPDEKPEPKKKADKPKASWEKSDEKPTEKSGSWQPPPVEPPRVPKPRAQTAPPRASWETPAEGVPVAAPPKPAPVAAPIMAPTPTPAPAPVASPAMPPAPVTTTSMPVRDDAPFDPIPAGSPEIAPYDSVPSRDDAPYDPIPASAPENWQSSGTWESGSVSATAPIAAELPAPQSASVIVERRSEPAIEVPSAVTSAGMITPAAPAYAMVDDPRLPTLPQPEIAAVVEKPKKRPRTRPPEFIDDEELEGGDGGRKGGSRKLPLILALVAFVGLGIGALVWLGGMNKERFFLACEPQQVIAKQGRGFPPWGERNIDDDAMWKPIKIPPNSECTPRETDDQHELSRWYLEILVDRASHALTAKEGATHDSKEVDEAFAQLEQALLHARSSDRREQRRDIERLLGDVGYWRATGRLRDAANALTEAAKQFDAAAVQRPRHVSDANAWATHVRKLVEQLKAGPNGASPIFPPQPTNPDRQPAPPGVALPVEPPKAGSGSAVEPAPPADAGMPTGGVLL